MHVGISIKKQIAFDQIVFEVVQQNGFGLLIAILLLLFLDAQILRLRQNGRFFQLLPSNTLLSMDSQHLAQNLFDLRVEIQLELYRYI